MPRPRLAIFPVSLAIALLFAGASALAPTTAFAQNANLGVGETAIVSNSGGEGVSLREGPGFDAAILDTFPDGSVANLIDGPIYAEDGSVWFGVVIDGLQGYMLTDYLLATGATTTITTNDGSSTSNGPGPHAGHAGDSGTSAVPGTISTNVAGDGATTINADGVDDTSYDGGAPQRVQQEAPTVTQDASGADGQLSSAQTIDQPQPDPGIIGDPSAVPAGQPAAVNDLVNLRAAPAADAEVLRVLPAGSEIVVTGDPAYGWTPAWFNGTYGFIAEPYIAPAGTVAAQSIDAAQHAARQGTATILEDAELKENPSPNAAALAWVPAGSVVDPSSGPRQGFYEVAWDGQTGWVSGAFLAFDGDSRAGDAPPPPPPPPASSDPATTAPEKFSGLAWPIHGGEWTISQGYNGTSHINDGEWQYQYSLDLMKVEGDTAGQEVYAPAAGTVRWTDPSTGGVSIDLGNGHAVALFHLTLSDALKDGTPLSQGDLLGAISPPGGMGFREVPHVHLALWETSDGGNWDRHAIPFTGEWALPGIDLPDVGGTEQHTGATFQP
ncbi:MAG: SH3 domain-containing protein [Thermomicrobiales bacterium]